MNVIHSLDFRLAHKIARRQLQCDAVVFFRAAGVDEKTGAAGDGSQLQKSGAEFTQAIAAAQFSDQIRNLPFGAVHPQIAQVSARVVPNLFVHRNPVLPLRFGNLHLAEIGEVGAVSLGRGGKKHDAKKGCGYFHHEAELPFANPESAVVPESLSQSRWYTNEIPSSRTPRTIKLMMRYPFSNSHTS